MIYLININEKGNNYHSKAYTKKNSICTMHMIKS